MTTRPPNSQECSYYGRKLSNIVCDDIEVSDGYVVIGSEKDDEIYFGDCLKEGEKMLKERVSISLIKDGVDMNDTGHYIEVDLEDVLRFSRRHCNGIYERVAREVTPYDE